MLKPNQKPIAVRQSPAFLLNRWQSGPLSIPRFWHEGEGGGNGEGGGTKLTWEEALAAAERKLKDKNAAEVVATTLNEKFAALGKLKAAEDKIKELEPKVAPEGAVVLKDKEEIEAWNWLSKEVEGGFKAAKDGLVERDTLKEKDTENTRKELVRSAARSEGYNEDALYHLASAKNLNLVEKEETKDGKPVKVYHVQGEDGKTTRLVEHVQQNESWALPSLTANIVGGNGGGSNGGRSHVRQQGGQGGSTSNGLGGKFADKVAARLNPTPAKQEQATT